MGMGMGMGIEMKRYAFHFELILSTDLLLPFLAFIRL